MQVWHVGELIEDEVAKAVADSQRAKWPAPRHSRSSLISLISLWLSA
jgi:hypothetical protein